MFEQTLKNIDDVLREEAGCTTELDYTEQSSWMLFLKYLDDLEAEKAMEAELMGKPYEFIIDDKHRWSSWAAPKKADGSFDHDKALTGDDLIDYVNRELFPYLQDFKQRASGADTIEYKIGEIFGEIKSKEPLWLMAKNTRSGPSIKLRYGGKMVMKKSPKNLISSGKSKLTTAKGGHPKTFQQCEVCNSHL